MNGLASHFWPLNTLPTDCPRHVSLAKPTRPSALQKRSLILRDDSNCSIELTLWGKYANEPGDQLHQVRQRLMAAGCRG